MVRSSERDIISEREGLNAEIHALKAAGKQAYNGTAYVSLEPCCHQGKTGPCTQAIIEAGISKVVFAMQDPNPLVAGKGAELLRHHGITVEENLMELQAIELNRGFVKRMSQGLPWVTVKSASSLDGRTALKNGESKWITSAPAREDVQKLRARHDAIMTGIGTVIADDPSMNVRLTNQALGFEGDVIQPLRIVIDRELKMLPGAKMLTLQGRTLIFVGKNTNIQKFAGNQQCELLPIDDKDGQFCLREVLEKIASLNINNVLVEAGPKLIGQLLKQGLVDEWISYVAPKLMGSNAQGMLEIENIESIDKCISLDCTDVRQIGNDLRITSLIKH